MVDEVSQCFNDDYTYNLVIPKECLKLAGKTKLTLAAEYDNYCSKKDITIHICREYELKKEQYLDFSKQYSSGILHCVNKDGYANYVTSDGVLNISVDRALDLGNGEPYIEIPESSEIIKNIADDDIIHISYDLTPGSASVNFMQAFFGKFKILSSGGKFFADGSVSYEVNKTYHIEFIINTAHKLYRVYISDMDGNLLTEKRGEYDEPYSFRCRMYISTSSGKGSVIFDNLRVETSKYICPDLKIFQNDGKYELSGALKCGGDIDVSGHTAYVGYYNEDNVMIHFDEIDIFASDTVCEELAHENDTKLIKFFFWDKDLTPVTGLELLDIQSEAQLN